MTAPKADRFQDRGDATLGTMLKRTFEKHWKGTPSEAKCLVNMGKVEEYFGRDTPISRIDADAIDGFIKHLEAQGNANGTINRKLAVLSKTLTFAHERRVITHKPKVGRKTEEEGRIRWLTPQEEKALLDLLRQWEKHDHADVIEVLIDTGFRPSELYRLTPVNVDLKAGTITLWPSITKTKKPRTIYMTSRVKRIIGKRMSAVTAPNAKLFPYDNFWMRYVWDRARAHLGFTNDPHFVPYICRHTCASRMVQNGVPLGVVRDWMGHKAIEMTTRYAHLAPHNLKAAAEVLDMEKATDEKVTLAEAIRMLAEAGILPSGIKAEDIKRPETVQ